LLIRELLWRRSQRASSRVCATYLGLAMGGIEISYDAERDANPAREQSSDVILNQLVLATIMLSLEMELRAFVRALNAAQAGSAPVKPAQHRLLARLLGKLASFTGRLPARAPQQQLRHSPA
jgi:hypothetical protein